MRGSERGFVKPVFICVEGNNLLERDDDIYLLLYDRQTGEKKEQERETKSLRIRVDSHGSSNAYP